MIHNRSGKEGRESTGAEMLTEGQRLLLMSQLRNEQSLGNAVSAGLVASVIGAVLWAALTAMLEYQSGLLAIAIGFLVGWSVRYFGKGIDKIFGFVGALFALLGCLVGNAFTIIALISINENTTVLEVLSKISMTRIFEMMVQTFDPIDLLFYGIAAFEGYRISIKQITEEDIEKVKHL